MKTTDKINSDGLLRKNGTSLIIPFVLITSCFMLWGFATNVTTPMVKAFSKIFRMGVTEGAMVQVAFYLGYFAMAFPAAIFIQKYSYKAGVLVGLSLYAAGALLFFPAKAIGLYEPFLLVYFIMTCGLSFLETTCSPYVYCMGSEETATQRLSLSQSFYSVGCLAGLFVAMEWVQERMNPMDTQARAALSETDFNALKDYDLGILIQPYVFIGIVLIVLLITIWLKKMPMDGDTHASSGFMKSLIDILKIKNYREGVITQFFYMGAQVMCWTFIIQYGTRVFMAEGMAESEAEILSQKFNIAAMIIFMVSRFVCTWLLRYVKPTVLLAVLGVAAAATMLGAVLFTDRRGIYCIVAVSAFMSFMYPIIYGIALNGLGEKVKMGAAGLVMAILGGSFFPPLQAAIIDIEHDVLRLPTTNVSFLLTLLCFVVVAIYGFRAHKRV